MQASKQLKIPFPDLDLMAEAVEAEEIINPGNVYLEIEYKLLRKYPLNA